jgi:hypothetical protein
VVRGVRGRRERLVTERLRRNLCVVHAGGAQAQERLPEFLLSQRQVVPRLGLSARRGARVFAEPRHLGVQARARAEGRHGRLQALHADRAVLLRRA